MNPAQNAATPGDAAYAPCPTCHQYSHSIADDKIAEAFMHFETMIAHPVRGHPLGQAFDEKTRDAAQVLAALARAGGDGWRPIAEAPRDGTWVLARGRDWGRDTNPWHVMVVFWTGDRWLNAYDHDTEARYLREWLCVLPAAPNTEGEHE